MLVGVAILTTFYHHLKRSPRDNLKWPEDEVKGAVEPRTIKLAKFAGPAPKPNGLYLQRQSVLFFEEYNHLVQSADYVQFVASELVAPRNLSIWRKVVI